MKKQLIALSLMAMLIFTGCNSETSSDSQVDSTSTEPIASSEPTTPETGDVEETKETGETEENAIIEVMAETEDHPELEQLIIANYEIPEDYFAETRYYYNYVDLDNDGTDEIFVVIVGSYTSGSGGNSGMIVHSVDGKLHIKQEFTLLQTPIIISDTITDGAKEIIVYRSGGGVKGSYVRLTANEGVYTRVDDAIAIDSLEGITGHSIINNDLAKDMENGTSLTLE